MCTPASLWPLYEPDRNLWRATACCGVEEPRHWHLQPRWLDHAHPDWCPCACKYDLYMDPQFWDTTVFLTQWPSRQPWTRCPTRNTCDMASKRYFYGMTGRVLAQVRIQTKQKILLMIGVLGAASPR